MTIVPPASGIAHYIEDELLRAPLIWDQLLEAVLDQVQKNQRNARAPASRSDDELPRLLQENGAFMAAAYLGSLKTQTRRSLHSAGGSAAKPASQRGHEKGLVLELVDLDSIALDVELSRVIQAIKDSAEHELRDLQAFLAALVGDADIEEDHNPLHPAAHGRALRAAALAMRAALPQQLGFVRIAVQPFAQLMRQAYAAACTRLEEAGVEPASHRCIVLPDGKRRLQILPDVAYVPDLHRIRDAMPRAARSALSRERMRGLTRPAGLARSTSPGSISEAGRLGRHTGRGIGGGSGSENGRDTGRDAGRDTGRDTARGAEREPARGTPLAGIAERQAVELVNRLFKAFPLDERVPSDVREIIAQLRGPAMRLTLRDPAVLDQREHPVWRFIHLFAYQAEMLPKRDDPERARWLAFGRQSIDELAAAPMQKAAEYQRAFERMEAFLQQRLAQRCSALATRFAALQATEGGLAASQAGAAGQSATLDATLAALLPRAATVIKHPSADETRAAAEAWFNGLVPGLWLRVLLKGSWWHAQLLWQGERRQIVMLGDGATDTTWALRRGVLLEMHRHGLAKTLQMRSLVGTAAMRVQEQITIPDAA